MLAKRAATLQWLSLEPVFLLLDHKYALHPHLILWMVVGLAPMSGWWCQWDLMGETTLLSLNVSSVRSKWAKIAISVCFALLGAAAGPSS